MNNRPTIPPNANSIEIIDDNSLSSEEQPQVSHQAAQNNASAGEKIVEQITKVEILTKQRNQCSLCSDGKDHPTDHTLVTVKCGHVYGLQCLESWLKKSSQQNCLKCNQIILPGDIRTLFVTRISAFDRRRERKMINQIIQNNREKKRLKLLLGSLKKSFSLLARNLREAEQQNLNLKNETALLLPRTRKILGRQCKNKYGLFLRRNISLSSEKGSTVMAYSDQSKILIVSQTVPSTSISSRFGIRYIDMQPFRISQTMSISDQPIKDICLSENQSKFATITAFQSVKIFNVRNPYSNHSFKCEHSQIWACSFGKSDRAQVLHLGGEEGSVHTYDIRFAKRYLNNYKAYGDTTNVIKIDYIKNCTKFPNGAILLCTVQFLWLFEYREGNDDTSIKSTCLSSLGPFISMNYNAENYSVLLATRGTRTLSQSCFIIGTLDRVMDQVVLSNHTTLETGNSAPVAIRSNQYFKNSTNIVCGYMQKERKLTLFDTHRRTKVYEIPSRSLIYDMHPIEYNDKCWLATLTEKRCRIFKFTASP